MESLFGNPDYFDAQLGAPASPIQLFHDITPLFEKSPKNFFEYCQKEGVKESEEMQSYDKDIAHSSELEREADYTFNYDLSPDHGKDWAEKSQFCLAGKSPNQPNALPKVALTHQTNSTTQIEYSSQASQEQEEASESGSEGASKSKFSTTQNPSGDTFSQQSVKSTFNPQGENIDEGNLIFLVRKVDRKTNKSQLLTKHRKKITKCPHRDLEYYAKGMCKNCYHNKGKRSKKASKCDHLDRDHYAKGLCKNCYLHFFHIKKKMRKASASTKASAF